MKRFLLFVSYGTKVSCGYKVGYMLVTCADYFHINVSSLFQIDYNLDKGIRRVKAATEYLTVSLVLPD